MNSRTEAMAYRAALIGTGLGAIIILIGAIVASLSVCMVGLAVSVVSLVALFHLQSRLLIRSAEQQRIRTERLLQERILAVSHELQRQTDSFEGVARDIEVRITSRVPSARGFAELKSGIDGLIRIVTSMEAIVISEMDAASNRTIQSLGGQLSAEAAAIALQNATVLSALETASKTASRNANRILDTQAKGAKVQSERLAVHLSAIRHQIESTAETLDSLATTTTLLDARQADSTVDLRDQITTLAESLARSTSQLSDHISAVSAAQQKTGEETQLDVMRLSTIASSLSDKLDDLSKVASDQQLEAAKRILSRLGEVARALDATASSLAELKPSVTQTHEIVASSEANQADFLRHLQNAGRTGDAGSDIDPAEVVEIVTSASEQIDRLQKSLTEGFRATRVGLEQLPQTVEQYRHMHELLASGQLSLPGIGGWAMTSTAIASVVARVLEAKSHPTVVELGSGISTVWLSLAMKRRGGGRLISLDHLKEFLGQTANMVGEHGATEFVEFVHAPLVPTEIDGENFSWYDLSGLDRSTPIDILIVDGPPGDSGPQARYPALPMFSEQLAEGSTILVDDTIRLGERQVISRWQQKFDSLDRVRELDKATLLTWTKS